MCVDQVFDKMTRGVWRANGECLGLCAEKCVCIFFIGVSIGQVLGYLGAGRSKERRPLGVWPFLFFSFFLGELTVAFHIFFPFCILFFSCFILFYIHSFLPFLYFLDAILQCRTSLFLFFESTKLK